MNSEMQLIVPIAGFIFSLVMVIVLLIFLKRKKQNFQNASATIGEYPKNTPVSFTHRDLTFTYIYHPPANKAPSYLSLSIPCRTGGAFQIKKETRVEKFFKWLTINQELQTGDFKFDEKLYIISEDLPFTRQSLLDSRIRQAIVSLFQIGASHVTVNPTEINAIIEPFKTENFTTDKLYQMSEKLADMNKYLPAREVKNLEHYKNHIPQHRANPFKGPWTGKRILSYIQSFVILMIAPAFLALGLVHYPPLDPGLIFIDSLQFSLPVLVLVIWSMILLLRGRANSHIDFIMVFCFNLIAIPMLFVGVIYFFNGQLDNSSTQMHEVGITHKYFQSDKNGKRYYLVVNSWRSNREKEDIRTDYHDWNRVQVNHSRIRLMTRSGYFNYEWLENYQLKN